MMRATRRTVEGRRGARVTEVFFRLVSNDASERRSLRLRERARDVPPAGTPRASSRSGLNKSNSPLSPYPVIQRKTRRTSFFFWVFHLLFLAVGTWRDDATRRIHAET